MCCCGLVGVPCLRVLVRPCIVATQCRSVQELSIQYEPHDLLTHLPPQLLQESELDRRYSSLMESKGGWGGGMSCGVGCV